MTCCTTSATCELRWVIDVFRVDVSAKPAKGFVRTGTLYFTVATCKLATLFPDAHTIRCMTGTGIS